jgi:hypothetical protein
MLFSVIQIYVCEYYINVSEMSHVACVKMLRLYATPTMGVEYEYEYVERSGKTQSV